MANFITPLLHCSITLCSILAEMWQNMPRLYPLLGLGGGYALLMLFNPVQPALRDGFRCVARFKRVWLAFAVLGFAYFVFQFATFTPIQTAADLDLVQITSLFDWRWPRFTEVWIETPLPALEGVAGIFDNATTTYPMSVIAAVLMITNWRGLHGVLFTALRKRFRFWSYFIYLILLVSVLASLLKPIVFAWLPQWSGAKLLMHIIHAIVQLSASQCGDSVTCWNGRASLS